MIIQLNSVQCWFISVQHQCKIHQNHDVVHVCLDLQERENICVCLRLTDCVSVLVSVPSVGFHGGAFVLHFA